MRAAAEFWGERVEMMQARANYLDELRSGRHTVANRTAVDPLPSLP